jgi:hypothetical protein
MASPQQVAARIERNLARLGERLEIVHEAHTERVYGYERRIVHKVTHDLHNSLTPVGPYRAGPNIESRIVPVGIRYAEAEERRGGPHAFASRARAYANKGSAQIAVRQFERELVRAVEGGR